MNSTLISSNINVEEGLFFFEFERQFIEAGFRCIPMCVRYKLDIAGIKLKLETWCKLNKKERFSLGTLACYNQEDIARYESYLVELIRKYESDDPIRLPAGLSTEDKPIEIYQQVSDRCIQYGIALKWNDWMSLTALERFALSKLWRYGHESKNFIPALKEFGLLNKWPAIRNE